MEYEVQQNAVGIHSRKIWTSTNEIIKVYSEHFDIHKQIKPHKLINSNQ